MAPQCWVSWTRHGGLLEGKITFTSLEVQLVTASAYGCHMPSHCDSSSTTSPQLYNLLEYPAGHDLRVQRVPAC